MNERIETLLNHKLELFLNSTSAHTVKLQPEEAAKELQSKFSNILPEEIRNWIKNNQYPLAYKLGKHYLAFEDNPRQLKIARAFLRAVPEIQTTHFKEAQQILVRLGNEQVHIDYHKAATEDEKCAAIASYLNEIEKAGEIDQENLKKQVSQLAFGPWGHESDAHQSFEFPLTLTARTCSQLALAYGTIKKSKTPVELELPNQPLNHQMAFIIHTIALTNQGLLSDQNNCKLKDHS